MGDGDGKPVIRRGTAGPGSESLGADLVRPDLPRAAKVRVGDKGEDRNRLRQALALRGIEPWIPGRAHRKKPIPYDRELDQSRTLGKRGFGRLQDWRRVVPREDRCAHTFFRAIGLAATVIFW